MTRLASWKLEGTNRPFGKCLAHEPGRSAPRLDERLAVRIVVQAGRRRRIGHVDRVETTIVRKERGIVGRVVIAAIADNFDYVVIDGEAGIEQVNRRVMQRVSHMILV